MNICSSSFRHRIFIRAFSVYTPVKAIFSEHFGIVKIPCYAQFMNILGNIDADSLNVSFMKWCKLLIEDNVCGRTIAMDRKTVCATANMQSYSNPLHIVSAYITKLGITIGQLATEAKSNEIPTVQALIELLCGRTGRMAEELPGVAQWDRRQRHIPPCI